MNIRRVLPSLVAAVTTLTGFLLQAPAHSQSLVGGATTTKVILYNASNADVTVMVVCPPTGAANIEDGCATDMAQFRYKDLSSTTAPQSLVKYPSAVNTQAWFTLKRGQKVQFYNDMVNPFTGQKNYCMQGMVFGFGQFGNSCPGTTLSCVPGFPDTTPGPNFNNNVSPPVFLPNGSNSFEPTLNMPGTIGGVSGVNIAQNESCDISCNNGANCKLRITYTPPAGGPYWQVATCNACGGSGASGTIVYTSTTHSENSWVNMAGGCDNNCVDPITRCPRNGVFPYGATHCNICPDTQFPNPQPQLLCGNQGNPACNVTNQFCGALNGLPPNNGCGFNRGPKVVGGQSVLGSFGGTLQVTYFGPITPGSCPPPSAGCTGTATSKCGP